MQTVEYRAGLEVLGRQESLKLVSSQPGGSVTAMVGGSPTVYPVHHHVVDADTIVFRSNGMELPYASSGVPMSLEVDGIDDTGQDWRVAVRGLGREVVPAELARLRELRLEPPSAGPKGHWARILVDTISGRRST